MRVIYLDQANDSLEELIKFWTEDLEIPIDLAFDFKDRLLENAESLALHPFKGQKEKYLTHLNKEHRRLVDGHVKNHLSHQ